MKRKKLRSTNDALCCCEYTDQFGETNHILACCCDCSVVDSACDRLISCEKIPSATVNKMFATIEDRIRIPWCTGKGAIKVKLDIALPVIIVPLGILIGTLHSALTILVMVFMPLSLLTLYRIWLRQHKKGRTKLFYAWGVISFVQMYLTFQTVVVSYREILLWENMLLHTLILVMLYAFYHAKKDPGIIRRELSNDDHMFNEKSRSEPCCDTGAEVNHQHLHNESRNTSKDYLRTSKGGDECCSSGSQTGPVGELLMKNFGLTQAMVEECIEERERDNREMENVIPAEIVTWVDSRMVKGGAVAMWCNICRIVKPPRAGHCPVCNVCILSRDHHCIWIDNCVGANNHRAFFIAIIFFLLSCGYGIHLSMTTICTPVIYWDWFLVPNDCRYLYADFPTALSFVSTVYSTCAMIGMSLVFITQFILISQNVTSHEMHTSTFRKWIKYGVCVMHNSLNKGTARNFLSFLRGGRKRQQQYTMIPHSHCDCV